MLEPGLNQETGLGCIWTTFLSHALSHSLMSLVTGAFVLRYICFMGTFPGDPLWTQVLGVQKVTVCDLVTWTPLAEAERWNICLLGMVRFSLLTQEASKANAVCDDLMTIHVVTLYLLIACESTTLQGESSLLSGMRAFKFICFKKEQPGEASSKSSTSRKETRACPHHWCT